MVRKFELILVTIRVTQLIAIVIAVDKGRVVIVIDIQVQANEVLLVFLQAIARLAARVIAVNILGNAVNAVIVRLA